MTAEEVKVDVHEREELLPSKSAVTVVDDDDIISTDHHHDHVLPSANGNGKDHLLDADIFDNGLVDNDEGNINVSDCNGNMEEHKVELECERNDEELVHVQNQIDLDHRSHQESAESTGQNDTEIKSQTVAQEDEPQTQLVVTDASVSDVNASVMPLPADSEDHIEHTVSDSAIPVEVDQTVSEHNDSSEEPEYVIVESAPGSLTAKVSVEGDPSFCEVVESKQNVEPASSPVPDIQPEADLVEGHVFDTDVKGLPDAESVEGHVLDTDVKGLPAADNHDNCPGTNLVDQDTPQQNGHLDDTTEAAQESGNLPIAPLVDEVVESEAETEASAITHDALASAEAVEPESQAVNSDIKKFEIAVSHPVDCTNVELAEDSCPADEHDMPDDAINAESEVTETITEGAVSQSIPVDDTGEESHASDTVNNDNSLPACPAAEMKSESEIHNGPDASGIAVDETIVAETQKVNSSDINSECANSDTIVEHADNDEIRSDVRLEPDLRTRDPAVVESTEAKPSVVNSSVTDSEKQAPNSALDISPAAENGLIHLPSEDIEDKPGLESQSTDVKHTEEASASLPEESSTVEAPQRPNVGAAIGKRWFNYIVKIPRYDDENLREKMNNARLQLERKTADRDAIRVKIQKQKAICKEYDEKFGDAIAEEKAARELLKLKRQEIDSAQSVINKVKNAMSVEDLDIRLRNLDHTIEHETLPLKEEKQIIREIKQLKQQREQLSSYLKQDEVQQALNQKDEIDERLKVLRKEADSLRANVLKAEAVTQAAKKKYYDESDILSEFQSQFKVADEIRQEAYTHLVSLRRQLNEKNKYYHQYRNDLDTAKDLVAKGDRDAIQRLCVNQVENLMTLWNENDEFHKEYIRCNMRSTLWRLKTTDGRSLGPNEEPPVIPSNERVAKDRSAVLISASESEVKKQEQVAPAAAYRKDDKTTSGVGGEQRVQSVKSKKTAKPVPSQKPAATLDNGLATVSGRDDVEEAREEVPKRTKEEEELAQKAAELRKEEEAAKLKEQRKLEEKAKAKEAMERKKRNAEKAQARAAVRAQKEAELKEKEREKKLRKKEKRKAGAAAEDTNNVENEADSDLNLESVAETPREGETKERATAVTKKLQYTKQQSKAKSIPPPLRNRGKKRMQAWMWAVLVAVIAIGLFMVGNSGFSFNFGYNFN